MTPDQLAEIHRAAFRIERPWSAVEFADLLESRFVELFQEPGGFALARTLAGESELLTLAVDPASQGRGIGRRLTERWLDGAGTHADTAFLEVASDNTAALGLYRSLGFAPSGLRKAYYARNAAPAADAIVMRRCLTFGHSADSMPPAPESG